MKCKLEELEKLLTSESSVRNDSAERHLKGIGRESAKVFKALRNLGKKLAEFAADESVPNDIQCHVWENVRERCGISKTLAKFLCDKYSLIMNIEKELSQGEKLTVKEFFDMDCLLGNLSRRDIPESVSPEESAHLILLARKHGKAIPYLFGKMKEFKGE